MMSFGSMKLNGSLSRNERHVLEPEGHRVIPSGPPYPGVRRIHAIAETGGLPQAAFSTISASAPSDRSALTYASGLSTHPVAAEPDLPTPAVACFDNSTLQITGTALSPAMTFEILASSASSTSVHLRARWRDPENLLCTARG